MTTIVWFVPGIFPLSGRITVIWAKEWHLNAPQRQPSVSYCVCSASMWVEIEFHPVTVMKMEKEKRLVCVCMCVVFCVVCLISSLLSLLLQWFVQDTVFSTVVHCYKAYMMMMMMMTKTERRTCFCVLFCFSDSNLVTSVRSTTRLAAL